MKNLSRYLSLILRHKPESVGVSLDECGWVSIKDLVQGINNQGNNITENSIKKTVQTDNKSRYSIENGMIRANQGHSIKVNLNLTAIEPPQMLYHGTPDKFLLSIMREGLKKMKRHHVHLSSDKQTALQVGQRRGKAEILEIEALRMFNDGYKFYKSENGVWLTDTIPPQYIL